MRDFGFFTTGYINAASADGDATLYLKVIGEKKTVNATVNLAYRSGRDWRVVGASYETEAGKRIVLLDGYDDEGAAPTGAGVDR